MYTIKNLTSPTGHIATETMGVFTVIEHAMDYSVSPAAAQTEYFMSQMNVKRRQVAANLDGSVGLVLQAGAMQWTVGDVHATTGIKGVSDFLGKMVKGAVSKESAVKPEYVGCGLLVTEPTYRYLLLENAADWYGGLVKDSTTTVPSRNEGLFNLKLTGSGACVLESAVPRSEIVEVVLNDDVLKIDGHFAICWSGSLNFTVERSGKTLVGSAASGEGLVNVYRGSGRILLASLASS